MKRGLQVFSLVVLVFTALVFVAMPLADYFRNTTYAWEMSFTDFTQGGIEALGLFGGFVITAMLPIRRYLKVAIYLLGSLAYLRLHDVDLPFLFGLLWLEGMLATGAWLCPLRMRLSSGALFTVRFVTGISIWVLGALLLSMLHLATAKGLFWYSALLFLASTLALRKEPFSFRALKYLAHHDPVVAACSIYMLLAALVLSARAVTVVEFDSIWYGLRSEWVLAPYGSIFDHLNLVTWVYYYPKLFEFLTLPSRYLIDFSFLYAINIVIYFAMGMCALAIMRLCGMRLRHAMLAAVLVMSMPAMTSMCMTAKPDMFAAYLLLVGCMFFIMGLPRGRSIWLLGTLVAVALALSTKLIAIPFGGLLSLSALIALYRAYLTRRHHDYATPPAAHNMLLALSVMGALIFGAFLFRTYHLTGLPLVGDSTVDHLFESMGFKIRNPTSPYLPGVNDFRSDYLTMFYDYLFQPTALPHAAWVWPGNAGAFMITAGGLYAALSRPRPTWSIPTLWLIPIVAAGCILAISFGRIPGGDGNYYIFPVTLATLLGLGCLWQSGRPARIGLWMIFPMFIGAGSYLGFLLSPGAQHPGSAAFSLDLTRPPLHAAHDREAKLRDNGYWPIEQFIVSQMPGTCRGLATGDWDTLYRLSCIVENFARNGRDTDDPQSVKELVDYMNFARINLLIVPKFPAHADFYALAMYLRGQGVPVIETPIIFALDLREIAGKIPLPPARTMEPAASTTDLITLIPTAQVTDLQSPGGPVSGLVKVASNAYAFFTEAPALLVNSGVAMRFPLNPSPAGLSGAFIAAVGLRPEDTLAGNAPLTFAVRLLASDGKELVTSSWLVAAGDYRSVRLEFQALPQNDVRYIELRCTQAASAGVTSSQLLIAEPRVQFYRQDR
jgi:hypothetical protein